jgi:hypothetical protein
MICGNQLLEDRFKCPYHPRNLQCKNIDWWTCRDYQNDNQSNGSEGDGTDAD